MSTYEKILDSYDIYGNSISAPYTIQDIAIMRELLQRRYEAEVVKADRAQEFITRSVQEAASIGILVETTLQTYLGAGISAKQLKAALNEEQK